MPIIWETEMYKNCQYNTSLKHLTTMLEDETTIYCAYCGKKLGTIESNNIENMESD